jgi:hypothetical protein
MNVATSDTAAASRLVAAFERIWAAIRANHPDVPELVIVVAADQLDDLGALDSGGRAGVVMAHGLPSRGQGPHPGCPLKPGRPPFSYA